MNLEFEFGYRASIAAPLEVGTGPYGTRMVFEVTGGSFEGKRLKGKILTGGADWLLVGPDGWGRIDVRAQFVTDDGAALYLSYTGLVEINEKAQQALGGSGATDYGDHYFRTTPRIETGDPRYAWLNRTVFVAEGRLQPGRVVEYKVYRVA